MVENLMSPLKRLSATTGELNKKQLPILAYELFLDLISFLYL